MKPSLKLTVEDIASLLEAANVVDRLFPAAIGTTNPSPMTMKDKVAALGRDDLYALSKAIGSVRKVGKLVGKIDLTISSK